MINGRYSVSGRMDMLMNADVNGTCRVTIYPDGSGLLMCSDRAIFRAPGWERVPGSKPRHRSYEELCDEVATNYPEGWMATLEHEGKQMETSEWAAAQAERREANVGRAMRRARTKVRDAARSNDFSFFVTLTLDQARVDRYDVAEVTKKLNRWLDNAVRRRGLIYVLVPELHKDGAIHFHGFFNDVMEAVDSGTMTRPGGGRPRRPRSGAERRRMEAEGWQTVYNLPQWTLGFTTAIRLYGEKDAAVGYVCKYITKAAESGKIGGRWYYSGGDLRHPSTEVFNADIWELGQMEGAHMSLIGEMGAALCCLRLDNAREFVEVLKHGNT